MILSVQIPFFNSTSQYGRDMSFSEINKKLREAFAVFVLTLKTEARLRHVVNLVFPLFFQRGINIVSFGLSTCPTKPFQKEEGRQIKLYHNPQIPK